MADCIEREAARNAILDMHCKSDGDGYVWILFGDAIRRIDNLPSVERNRGKWMLSEFQNKEETDNDNYQYECSCCGHGDLHAKSATVPYCWFCGAEMVGE